MEPVRRITGRAVPLPRSDVDTDQIIPAQHLKGIERTGFGEFLFAAWRKDPSFPLNRPECRGAPILLAGPNFGAGSSRQHAVWALSEWGFRAIIAPSFADIFRSNCYREGLLPVELPGETVRILIDAATADPSTEITVDLEARTVTGAGVHTGFEIDDFTRWRLMQGLDEIGLALRHEDAIAAYEARRPSWMPTTGDGGATGRPGPGSA